MKLGLEFNYIELASGVHALSIFIADEIQGNKVIDVVNTEIIDGLGPFLETETGEDRSKFYRSLALFESTIDESRVTLNW